MRKLVLLIGMGVATLFAQGAPPGWKALFDGKDLAGWTLANAQDKPAFRVEDGSIQTQPGSGMVWYSREKIGNCTLRVIYRMANSAGNAAIFIRIPEPPADETYARQHGLEVRIDDRGDDWHVSGVLNGIAKGRVRAVKMEGEWNTMDITMQGSRTIVKLNSALVSDYVAPAGSAAELGYVAIGHPEGQAAIWIREISVR